MVADTEGKSRKPASISEQLRVRRGKLSERCATELLFFAYTTGWDGTLSCTHSGILKSLRFKAGKLLDAKSNDIHDSSSWILQEMGILVKAYQKDKTPADSNAPSSSTMRLLTEQIREGKMQASEIEEFMHRRVRRILHDLMSWREGDYVLELSKIPRAEPALKGARSIPEMILREIKTVPDPVGLREILLNPELVVDPVTEMISYKDAIRLTAIEQRIHKCIRQPMPVNRIAQSEGLGLEATARILLGLHSIGFVRVPFRVKVKAGSAALGAEPSIREPQKSGPAAVHPAPRAAAKPPSVEELDLQIRSECIRKINRSFEWDPYRNLELEAHASDSSIRDAYTAQTEKLTSEMQKAQPETREYMVSWMNILEESQTILLNATYRTRLDLLRSMVDLNKRIKSAVIEHQKALQAFRDKRLPLAIVHYKFALQLDPRNSDYHYKLIYLLTQNKRLLMAARLLQEYSIENFGTNAHILALSGLIYHKCGNLPHAKIEYERALRIDSEQELAGQGLAILEKRSFSR
jgi:hypothetical protein